MEKIKIGIIICNRYRTCAGGKCLRALIQLTLGDEPIRLAYD